MIIEYIKSKIRGEIGKDIYFYDTLSSTNSIASDIAEKAEEGTVVLADCQEKGRGRRGRTWLSPPGVNIYMSVILRPDIAPKDSTLITLMAVVASAIALRKVTGLPIAIKWPNDLMVSDKKIGGILTEVKVTGKRIISAVVGIGINVNVVLNSFPEDIRRIATSVRNEMGKTFPRDEIVAEILNEMNKWYAFLKRAERRVLLSEWMHLTSTLGKEVKVTTGDETFSGFAESIDDEGLLVLRLPSGELKKISSGDLAVSK